MGSGTRTTRCAAADPEEGAAPTGAGALREEEAQPGAVGLTEAKAARGEKDCQGKRALECS